MDKTFFIYQDQQNLQDLMYKTTFLKNIGNSLLSIHTKQMHFYFQYIYVYFPGKKPHHSSWQSFRIRVKEEGDRNQPSFL